MFADIFLVRRSEGALRRQVLTAGDRERLTALFRSCAPRVLGYALRRTSREEAEEVVAETFTIAWRRLEEVPDEPIPWLLGVARRVLANQRRATSRRGAALREVGAVTGHTVPDPADEVEARIALLDGLSALSAWDREALLLVSWDGLSNAEAALVMNCAPKRFAVRLHRARRRLFARFDVTEQRMAEPSARGSHAEEMT